MPHGTLALAASIAAMSLAEIRDLLARREIASPRAVRDPLSLAVELLRPDSLEAALQKLNRGELTTLLSVEQTSGGRSPRNTAREGTEGSEAAHVDALRRIGLLGLETRSESLVALPETGLALERLRLRGLEVLPDLRAEPANGASSSGPHDAANAHLSAEPGAVDSWFGPALASTNRAAALLRALAHRPPSSRFTTTTAPPISAPPPSVRCPPATSPPARSIRRWARRWCSSCAR